MDTGRSSVYSYTLPYRSVPPPMPAASDVEEDDDSDIFIAIGIDFGTTYSGVSWAWSSNPKDLYEISGWSSHSFRNRREIQVPTLYDIDTESWGYEVTPEMTPIKWFKLLLLNDEDIKRQDIRDSPQLQEAREALKKHRGRLTAVELVGKFLKKIWDHTYAELGKQNDIEDLPLRVAITIPAIWPAHASNAMKEAARLAGIMDHRDIGETTLILVQEPEAAALSTLFHRQDHPLVKKDDSFVVCDAGGGTIDVISYTVTSQKPFRLKECVEGDGKLAGAFQVDEAFNRHLVARTNLKISSLTAEEYNDFYQNQWELGLKRSFDGRSDSEVFNLQPPIRALGTRNTLLRKGNLQINSSDMRSFFEESRTGIESLVSDQFNKVEKATNKPPKKILLVGGLGSSGHVYNELNSYSKFKKKVLTPAEGWSAVARGAVLRLLQENISTQRVMSPIQEAALIVLPSVVSRKSRYHYGIVVRVSTTNLQLDPDERPERDPEGVLRVSRMRWYLRKGEDMDKVQRIPITYHKFHREQEPLPRTCTFDIRFSHETMPPKREGKDVHKLCSIECEWDKPVSMWKTVVGAPRGWKKHEDLQLTMGLDGHPRWELKVGSNRAEHEFKVEYMS